jgi:hypothetical protein
MLPAKVQRYFNITELGDFVSPLAVPRVEGEASVRCATHANYLFPLDTTVDILEQAEFVPCPL